MVYMKRPNVYIKYCRRNQYLSLFSVFSNCNSTAHGMFSGHKQAHQQNKLRPHVRAIGEIGSGKYDMSSVNKY